MCGEEITAAGLAFSQSGSPREVKPLRLLTIAVLAGLVVLGQDDPPSRAARLNYMTGQVSFQPAGVTDWVDATINRPLTTGDHLWVSDNARAELHIGSTALRLNSNTAFQFLNLNDQTVQISLTEGTLTVRLRYLGENQVFEVDTPNMAFSLLRPGEYRIDASPDNQTTQVTVRQGQGEVTTTSQALNVPPFQQAIVVGDQQVSANLQPAPQPDGWDQWCRNRDRREDQAMSRRYVSPEVTGYEDLDAYGRWTVMPPYGPVWIPAGVPVGWAPYHFGHWVWVAPWGWTWVDDAPWGFAPFHYGRWAFVGGVWGWCPGPIAVQPMYAPALVAWVGGPRFGAALSFGVGGGVGWFALGFGEPFIPAYAVSPAYFNRVNVSNTVINRNINITNVYNNVYVNRGSITNIRYANQNVEGAVAAMPRTAFANGAPVRQAGMVVPAAQARGLSAMAAPSVAPQRTALLGPRAGSAAFAPRPPASVLNRPVVARTPPPPAPVPFERQQVALRQSPGRPVPPSMLRNMQDPVAPHSLVRMAAPARQAPGQAPASGWRTFSGERTQPSGRPPANAFPRTPPAQQQQPRQGGWGQPSRPPLGERPAQVERRTPAERPREAQRPAEKGERRPRPEKEPPE
jgi:hypothetical protein